MILEEYLFLRRRDEIRAEHGVAGYGSTSNSTRSNPATITASNSGNALKKASGSSRPDKSHHGDTKKSDISKKVRKNSSGPKPREYATFISIDTRV